MIQQHNTLMSNTIFLPTRFSKCSFSVLPMTKLVPEYNSVQGTFLEYIANVHLKIPGLDAASNKLFLTKNQHYEKLCPQHGTH